MVATNVGSARKKMRVAKLGKAHGFEPYDIGLITHAHVLEETAITYIDVQLQNRPDAFNFCFRSHQRLSPLDAH